MINDSPLFTGMGGQVWDMDIEAIRKAFLKKDDAGVGLWLINCPRAHPLWSHYIFCVFHLRPIEGVPPPTINLQGATHEVVLFAMSPDWVPRLDDPNYINSRLVPLNFAAQFCAGSDVEARRYCLRALNEIAEGVLSPDTDFMREWVKRFGDNMIKKEYRDGP